MNKINSVGIGFFAFLLILVGCTKLDTTNLGGDVIPEVDNIYTFADTLDIETTQGFFTDSDTIALRSNDMHVLGKISGDPLFGGTDAQLFLQLKPTFFPFYLGNSGDQKVELDSVVLCLNYSGFWGDSITPLTFQVNQVNPLADDPYWDSGFNFIPVSYGPNVGSVIASGLEVDVRKLKETVKISKGNDSVQYQVRLNLGNSNLFIREFFSADSSLSALNNGYHSDSTFKRKFPGLAVIPTGGNALLYTILSDAKTRLEIHYKKRSPENVLDTTFTSLTLIPLTSLAITPSSTANKIIRDRSTGSYPAPGLSQDEIYLQSSPGTYALLNIPGLTGYPNRVIHRAAIEVVQVPGDYVTDSLFYAPNYLYLDIKDTGATVRYKAMYFDLNPNYLYDPDKITSSLYYPGSVDYFYFGGFKKSKADPNTGREISYYNFNITRYVQHIATHQRPNYPLRLSAPYQFRYMQHSPSFIFYNNVISQGRVRVGGGNHPLYKMRMIIIYSRV